MSEIRLPSIVHVFFSYARQDQALRDRLEEHLSILKYRRLITTWHAQKISTGEDAQEQVETQLNAAHLILLLVSASFLSSEHSCGREMQIALERHKQGRAYVVPIILRPVLLSGAPFTHLWALPPNGKPVTRWKDREVAFLTIAIELEHLIERIRERLPLTHPNIVNLQGMGGAGKKKLRELYPDSLFFKEPELPPVSWWNYYQTALRCFEQAIQQDHTDLTAYRGKAHAQLGLLRYQEAIQTYQKALVVLPEPATYVRLGDAYTQFEHYPQAITAYENALQLDPNTASAYEGLHEVYTKLGNVRKAINIAQQATKYGFQVIYDTE